MTRASQFGLVLLVAGATGSVRAIAAPPQDAGSAAQFFFSGAAPRQGYLGVDVRDLTPDQVTALKLRDGHGAEVILVDHDAPAGKLGLREHDVIVQMNGQPIDNRDQVRKMLHDLSPGRTVQMVISRDGQQMSLATQMSSREEVERTAWEQHLTPGDATADSADVAQNASASAPRSGNSFLGSSVTSPGYTGALLEKMTGQLADFFGVPSGVGLLVRSVSPNSPAAQAGMHAGDVVVRAAAKTISSLADWTHVLKSSKDKSVPVVVLRDKKEQTLDLTIDPKKRSSVDRVDEPLPSASRLGLSFRSKK